MKKTLPILAALALVACLSAPAHAGTYRAKDSIGCESPEALRELFLALNTDDEAAGVRQMKALIDDGRCVNLGRSFLYVERTTEHFALVKISADPRPLWTFRSWIEWSAQ